MEQPATKIVPEILIAPDRERRSPSCVGPWSTFARTGSDLGSKVVDPAAHGLIGQDDSAHSQQIFHVAKAEREPKI